MGDSGTETGASGRPVRARVTLTDISSRAWEHPADRGALTALRQMKGFDTVRSYLATHLAWLAHEIGSAGVWLIETTSRHGLNCSRRQLLTSELTSTLEELTAQVPDSWCPNGSLEVTGLRVADWSPDHDDDRPFLDLDTIDLHLVDHVRLPGPMGASAKS